MARSPFMLAAVAASALPDLEIVSASADPHAADDVDTAIVTDGDGRFWRVLVPRTQSAEARLAADHVALGALTSGARARLPFTVPVVAGHTAVRPTRGTIVSWVPGDPASLTDLPSEPDGVATAIGRAIAVLHDLPTSVVTEAGLPVDGPGQARRWATSLAERAAATGMLPAAVHARWQTAIDDADLWQFEPTVIGGDLEASSFLVHDGELCSVTGWQGLAVGDPAADLAWSIPAEHVADAVFSGYADVAGSADRRLRHRAALRSELGLARWLLHGTERRDSGVVDDAVEMLTTLAERIHGDLTARIEPATAPVLTVDEVEDLLDRQRPAV